MFCVRCGKEGRGTIGGLCTECFLDGRPVVRLPHHVDLERCTNCGEFLIGGTWQPKDAAEAIEDAAADSLEAIPEARILGIGTGTEELDPRNFLVTVEADADVDGHVSAERCSTTVRLKNTVCKRCSRQLGNYYEATLQVRGGRKALDPRLRDGIVRRVRDQVEQMARNNRQLFITKVEETAGGVDILLSSISMARAVARELADSYGGDIKESSKLVGKTSDGGDLHRLTFLVRLPDHGVGDIVRYGDGYHKLTWTGKNGVRILSLGSFREVPLKRNDARNIRLAVEQGDIKEATVVSVSDGEIQVLHPENYSTVDLRIPEGAVIGDTVRVAAIDGDLYFVP